MPVPESHPNVHSFVANKPVLVDPAYGPVDDLKRTAKRRDILSMVAISSIALGAALGWMLWLVLLEEQFADSDWVGILARILVIGGTAALFFVPLLIAAIRLHRRLARFTEGEHTVPLTAFRALHATDATDPKLLWRIGTGMLQLDELEATVSELRRADAPGPALAEAEQQLLRMVDHTEKLAKSNAVKLNLNEYRRFARDRSYGADPA